MIFWIVAGIAALIIVGTFVAAVIGKIRNRGRSWHSYDYHSYPDFGDFGFAAFVSILGAFVVTIILTVLAGLFWHPIGPATETTRDLRAISTGDGLQGRTFFLGGGYIKSKRVLNYIVQSNGYSELDYEYASDSRIFEDTESPTVTQYYQPYGNEWLVPWRMGHSYSVDFHVPEDTVLEGYSITP